MVAYMCTQAAFRLYGDRVKRWATLNEPLTFCNAGYGTGLHAPGRCSDRSRCAEGDSTKEPALCSYHALLAHAAVGGQAGRPGLPEVGPFLPAAHAVLDTLQVKAMICKSVSTGEGAAGSL